MSVKTSKSLDYLRKTIFAPFLDECKGLTELAVNRPDELFTKEQGKWIRHEVKLSVDDCLAFLNSLANLNMDYIGKEKPILSGTLPTGERIQAILPPACEKNTISMTIRKPSQRIITHADFVSQGFYSKLENPENITNHYVTDNLLSELYQQKKYSEFLPECLRQGKTTVFCGGTGSGKTTFGNSVLEFIPDYCRMISIEDNDETRFRHHKNYVKLFYPADDRDAIITPSLLLRSCYRMNPDRILMTEIKGAEAWEFMKGTSSGHSGGITTVHENTPEDAICGIIERCYQNPECNNLPYNVLLRKVLNNIDVIMSIKYFDEQDKRFASGIYFKDLNRNEFFDKLKV